MFSSPSNVRYFLGGAFGFLFVACVGDDVVSVAGSSASSSSSSGTTLPTEPTPSTSGGTADANTPALPPVLPPGTARNCYPDADRDLYPGPGTPISMTSACPAGMTERAEPLDCDDSLTDVHPGQTRYFSTSRSGYDYNCDGSDEMGYFDSTGRQRTKYTECETASSESECTIRYNERTNGSNPPRCGQSIDGILACMWRSGECSPSAFEPITVRCR